MARIDADDVRQVEIALNSGRQTVHAHGATGATETIDLDDGAVHSLTLDANCTLTFTLPGEAASGDGFYLELWVTQDATGSRLITWPAAVEWPASTAPTLTTTAARTDGFAFTYDGSKWMGRTIGLDYNRA